MDKPKEVVCKNCGSIDDYWTEFKNGQQVAYCNGCEKYIKNVSYQLPKLYFGKYKGETINSITDLQYLKWCIDTPKLVKGGTKTAIEERIKKLEEVKNGNI